MSKHLPKTLETSKLQTEINLESGLMFSLVNKLNQAHWLSTRGTLFELEDFQSIQAPKDTSNPASLKVQTSLRALTLPSGQLELRLLLKNSSLDPLTVTPNFPVLRGVSLDGASKDLGYCFPQLIPEISHEVASWRRAYGGLFPLQFINVFHSQAGSLTLMTQDLTNQNKEYWIEKKENGKIDLGVSYSSRTLKPGELWELPPAVIDVHLGDWHEGLDSYRAWVQTWYNPSVPRKSWFQEVFNFRQHFLHENLGDPVINPSTGEYQFHQLLQEDIKAFGGVDYLQLFDWSSDPEHGRVGEYNPWDYLGGAEFLAAEIEKIQKLGIRVGLYLEGYLLDKRSTIAKDYGLQWTVKSKNQEPYYQMGGDYWHPCPHIPGWRDYLKNAVSQAHSLLNSDGIYIDQYGWGNQYVCHSMEHGHPCPSNQITDENLMMIQIRSALPQTVVLLSEYCPTDVSTQYQDGSFTYAKGIINLTRFALPDFKLFVIIRCDEPMGNDFENVKKIFFNGEGIWLEGPLSKPEWFPSAIRELLKKCYLILRAYRDSFTTLNPTPLVETLNPLLLANKFPGKNDTVWTLYNTSAKDLSGELIKVSHSPGALYYDVWNNEALTVRLVDEEAFLSLTIQAYDIGCIVKKFSMDF